MAPPRTAAHHDPPEPAGAFYSESQRRLQDRFDSRRLADRLGEVTVTDHLGDRARAAVEAADSFYLATADADGWPEVSYKGGRPGFVRVLDQHTLAFPSYDGNGMYRSLGNIADEARVGLLFVDPGHRSRLRIRGRARVELDPAVVSSWPGAEAVVVVRVDAVFPNCGRYLHPVVQQGLSDHAPAEGHLPPEPEWKAMAAFAPYLPRRSPGDAP